MYGLSYMIRTIDIQTNSIVPLLFVISGSKILNIICRSCLAIS